MNNKGKEKKEMKKILFLILLIGLVLLSVNLFADTSGDKEEIDCMVVTTPFNFTEGVSANIIIQDSFDYNQGNTVNRSSDYFVLYNVSLDSNEILNKYDNPVVSDNGSADVNVVIFVEPTAYKMRC
jgi:hypothetical protein